jgi:phosphoglycerol transferase MdoB-like AlkP superfamily enzyme
LYYFLVWTIFFQIARAVFLIYHLQKANTLNLKSVIGTFLYGLRMDLSMAAYITIPICLFLLTSIVLPFFKKNISYKIYTAIVLVLLILIIGSDLELYNQWGFRIDATPLRYFNTPKEIWATVSHLPLVVLFIGFVIVCLLFSFLSFRWIERGMALINRPTHRLYTLLLLIGFTTLLIIPIRGGFQLAPMNQSAVYFSTNIFANHAAINAPWNFLHGLKNFKASLHNPYQFMDIKKAEMITDSLFQQTGSTTRMLKSNHPNIILIIWESFTSKALNPYLGKEVTPFFNQLKSEGIFFDHLYASGDRTDKGLSAILSGYPALPATSIIRTPAKSAKLSLLSSVFKERGYSTSFYYGGETEFANIKSYLLQGNFDLLIDKNSFSKKDQNSKWGVHDGIVADRVSKDLQQNTQPFFTTWLTLSSHEPFEIPESPLFTGKDHTSQFLSSIHYTDQSVKRLIVACKEQPWWDNTLIIIIGDHGHPLPETGNRIDNFKIPMLWLGGALTKKGIVVDKIVSQTDLAATLTAQFEINNSHFPFSKNILASGTDFWSFFQFNDGFGFVQNRKYFLFDNVGKQIMSSHGEVTNHDLQKGQALQQFIYDDFINK